MHQQWLGGGVQELTKVRQEHGALLEKERKRVIFSHMLHVMSPVTHL